ncbi:MAG: hypothetical protein AAFA34_04395, partial [Thermoplasmata archaeon]
MGHRTRCRPVNLRRQGHQDRSKRLSPRLRYAGNADDRRSRAMAGRAFRRTSASRAHRGEGSIARSAPPRLAALDWIEESLFIYGLLDWIR